jgi:hypothetical protein
MAARRRRGRSVPDTPRLGIRMSYEEWDAAHTKAQAEGETHTAVLARLLAGYLAGNAQDLYNLPGPTRKDADSS